MTNIHPKRPGWRLPCLAPAVIVAVSLALAGCGGATTAGKGSSAAAGSKRIAFGFPFRVVDIYKPLIQAVKQEAKKKGYTVIESTSGISAAEQLAEVNTWIGQHVDAIVLFSLEPDSMAPVVKKAHDAGIKIIGYGEHIPGEDGSIVFNNAQGADLIGGATGKYINENLGGKANIGLLSFMTGEQNRIRTQNAIKKIASAAPDAKVAAEAQANDAGTALNVSRPMLSAHPDINVVVANTDDDINGFEAALKSAGKEPSSVWFASYDASTPVLKKMLSGEIKGIDASLPVTDVGNAVVDAADAALTGSGSKSIAPNYVGVTSDDKNAIKQLLADRGAA